MADEKSGYVLVQRKRDGRWLSQLDDYRSDWSSSRKRAARFSSQAEFRSAFEESFPVRFKHTWKGHVRFVRIRPHGASK